LGRASVNGTLRSTPRAASRSRAATFDREDRLPLRRVAREANARRSAPARELVRHVIETWAIAQHVYWAVGRGLQDARSGGKTILRLKLVIEEGGWSALLGRGRMTPCTNPRQDRDLPVSRFGVRITLTGRSGPPTYGGSSTTTVSHVDFYLGPSVRRLAMRPLLSGTPSRTGHRKVIGGKV
jgi:hypothetical protein